MAERPLPPRDGRCVVGFDCGAERSWSAAWALWESGRCEVYAVCPGVIPLDVMAKQDAHPRGLYEHLAASGALVVDVGSHLARPEVLIDHLVHKGIEPDEMVADHFQLGALRNAVAGRWPVHTRRTMWSNSTEDIGAFRKLLLDGNPLLALDPVGYHLAGLGFAQCKVHADTSGNVRIVKRRNVRSRDDIGVAAVLAAGAMQRRIATPSFGAIHIGLDGRISEAA